ncbi:phosphodiester glycosidase family protein [Paenibacillus sp. GCM10012303]|uniref:phosphodiester glycosidase family protein n=1 Tax=Paenibacillus sp. GCM10012303 TaxID=3317340 RepID=UPI0036061244
MNQARNVREWVVKQEETYRVAPGVYHTSRELRGRDLQLSVQMTEADVSDPYLRVETYSSGGGVTGLETVGEMLRQLEAGGKRIVAGYNGDFFSYAGVPSGLQITNGEVVTSPQTTKVLMAVKRDGTASLHEAVPMKMTVAGEDGEAVRVDMLNRAWGSSNREQAVLYNFRYGKSTRTSGDQVEAVIAVEEGNAAILPGRTISGTVVQVAAAPDTAIGEGQLVLSAAGVKAEWVGRHLVPGMRVRLDVSFGSDIDGAIQVVSGSSTLGCVLLRDGEVPSGLLDPAIRHNSDRHPRTMIAVKRGKLYLISADGRQAGHSDGITLAESGYYMQSLGMEQAINVDGGGSTTCYVRRPGEERAALCNRPSDGFERAVGNAVAIASTAPAGELKELVLLPGRQVRVLAGGTISFAVKGRDAYGNAVAIRQEQLLWKLGGEIGRLGEAGVFTAGYADTSGWVSVSCGDIGQRTDISVLRAVSRLQLEPSPLVVEPGGVRPLRAYAYDVMDERIWLSPEQLVWTVDGGAGYVTAEGIFHAAGQLGQGVVSAAYKEAKVEAAIRVGLLPDIIADFEQLDGITAGGVNAVEGSVSLVRAARPQPVRYGTFSGKLTYDFTDCKGVSEAVIRWTGEDSEDGGDGDGGVGREGRRIGGAPWRFGVWVCGDAKGHMLRLNMTDAEGRLYRLNMTGDEGVYWKGWKYVHAGVPGTVVFPVRVRSLSFVQAEAARKTAGTIYLDHFRAEYMDLNEDVEGPLIEPLSPAPEETCLERRPAICAAVADEGSGVHPSTIRMWLDGMVVDHRYDPLAGRVRFVPDTDLAEGEHRVVVEAADNNGTAAVPPVSWTFRIGRDA